jgi:hypothetical protein
MFFGSDGMEWFGGGLESAWIHSLQRRR